MTKAKQKPGPFEAIEPLPADAWGRSRVPAFAASERAGALLGLGYPQLVLPSTGTFTGTDDALRKLMDTRVVPRSALERVFEYYVAAAPKQRDFAADVETVMMKGVSLWVWILEALYGSARVAEAAVALVEKLPIKAWYDEGDWERAGWSTLRGLALVLWRVPATQHAKLRARLEAVWNKVSAHGEDRWRPTKALDVILHGRAGVERSGSGNGGRLHFSDLPHVDDDPAFVASFVLERLKTLRAADREWFNIQLAVIGGPKVLAAMRAETKRFKADKKSLELQLSLCA